MGKPESGWQVKLLQSGVMASKKATTTLPEIVMARELAHELDVIAFALENDADSDFSKSYAELVRHLVKARRGLAHPVENTEDVRARTFILATLRKSGTTLREEESQYKGPPLPEGWALERETRFAIEDICRALPEYQKRLTKEFDAVSAVIKAHARYEKGGRGNRKSPISDAEAALAKVMRWPSSGAARVAKSRQNKARRRAKSVTRRA